MIRKRYTPTTVSQPTTTHPSRRLPRGCRERFPKNVFLLVVVVTLLTSSSTVERRFVAAVPTTNKDETDNLQQQCNNNDDDTSRRPLEEECGIWLAPSTIPGAGLGMFAGKEFVEKQALQQSGDVVIPIVDLRMYHPEPNVQFLWDEYTWNGPALGLFQLGIAVTDVASPGFGSAANSFLDLINVEETNPIFDDDYRNLGIDSSPALHRSNHPDNVGMGAFTKYHNRESIAKTRIQQGQELFVDYGQNWFETRDYMGPVPLHNDLEKASKLFRKFTTMKQTIRDYETQNKLKAAASANNQTKTTTETIFQEIWNTFVLSSSWKDKSRTLGSFHTQKGQDEFDKLQSLYEQQRRRQQQDKDENEEFYNVVHALRVQESIRSKEFLKTYGTCADNIQEGRSTIQQAGRGGFATRHLKENSVVAHVPLIHIVDRTLLDMYEIRHNKSQNKTHVVHQQLLLNYCMGHKKSSLLLCNYGPMINLINHNQTLSNVKLQWPTTTTSTNGENEQQQYSNHKSEYLEKPVHSLRAAHTSVLAMELIALRDIQPNEELFLDYGDEWESAWNEHVHNWEKNEKLEDNDDYQYAAYYNDIYIDQGLLPLKTEFERLLDPYPGYIECMCDLNYLEDPTSGFYTHCEILERKVRKVQTTATSDHKTYDYVYTVYAFIKDAKHNTNEWDDTVPASQQLKKLENLPKEAFRFANRPYTTDMFLPNVFRHEIVLSDDLFPKQWMNLY